MSIETKPKLLLFRSELKDRPEYIQLHFDQHVKCLAEFFNVTLVSDLECDYSELCDKYEPDLAVFDSGIYAQKYKHRRIVNTSAHPQVPKVGFCHTDAFCKSRKLFLSDMARWGVETFFSLSVSLAEYTPDIAANLFFWPNFIDSEMYHDYGESKRIPVLFTGSMAPAYPWRNRIHTLIAQRFPYMMCQHFGWHDKQATVWMPYGDKYARLLNSAWVVPSCGTITNEVVRKHFEIPASKACLLTERTSSLEAAGFVDMVNCVFADEKNVISKLDHLFSNPDELQAIIAAGYDLVQSRHTLKHRNQLLQWLTLKAAVRPGEKIIQLDPFQPLVIVPESTGRAHGSWEVHGKDRALLRRADEHLEAGRYGEAAALCRACLNYYNIPEARLRLAICQLFEGKAESALSLIRSELNDLLERYMASDVDPVEWAYFLIALLCKGDVASAVGHADRFLSMRHPELDCARTVVRALRASGKKTELFAALPRYTLHRLPSRTPEKWLQDLYVMLRACGQSHIEQTLSMTLSARTLANAVVDAGVPMDRSIENGSEQVARLSGRPRGGTIKSSVAKKIKEVIRPALHYLEDRYGSFLPYRYSNRKCQELFVAIETMARQEDVPSIIIVGASAGPGITEACLVGSMDNPHQPPVVCISDKGASGALKRRYGITSRISFHETPREPIAQANKIGMIVINRGDLISTNEMQEMILSADIICLNNINMSMNFDMYQLLSQLNTYRILFHSAVDNGAAVFRKDVRRVTEA